MAERPTVQVPAAQTLETKFLTTIEAELISESTWESEHTKEIAMRRGCSSPVSAFPLRPLSCAKVDAMLKFRLCTRITVFFHLVLIRFLQMLSRSSESLLERRCSASSHSREQPSPRSPRRP